MVLSHDKRFHGDSMAVEAVKQHKVRCFYLDGGTYPVWEKLVLLVRSYGRIQKVIQTAKPPYIYHVTHKGRVVEVRLDKQRP